VRLPSPDVEDSVGLEREMLAESLLPVLRAPLEALTHHVDNLTENSSK
jgi:hypothetical protein